MRLHAPDPLLSSPAMPSSVTATLRPHAHTQAPTAICVAIALTRIRAPGPDRAARTLMAGAASSVSSLRPPQSSRAVRRYGSAACARIRIRATATQFDMGSGVRADGLRARRSPSHFFCENCFRCFVTCGDDVRHQLAVRDRGRANSDERRKNAARRDWAWGWGSPRLPRARPRRVFTD